LLKKAANDAIDVNLVFKQFETVAANYAATNPL